MNLNLKQYYIHVCNAILVYTYQEKIKSYLEYFYVNKNAFKKRLNYGMGHDYFIQSCRMNMILIYFRTGPLLVAIKAKTNVTRGHHPNHTTVPGPINSQHTHL